MNELSRLTINDYQSIDHHFPTVPRSYICPAISLPHSPGHWCQVGTGKTKVFIV